VKPAVISRGGGFLKDEINELAIHSKKKNITDMYRGIN
jgi:hypothetical protein